MIKRDQRGFTLIELLVVLAIVALIAIAATTTTFQVLASTKRSNDHMTAIRQVQNAGYWISNDVQMAQGVGNDDPDTLEVEFITLTWTEWDYDDYEDSTYHSITYSFQDLSDGIGKLKRTHKVGDGEGDPTLVAETLVAEYIDSNTSEFSFSEADGTWKLYIKATSGTATETREYEVTPRVNM